MACVRRQGQLVHWLVLHLLEEIVHAEARAGLGSVCSSVSRISTAISLKLVESADPSRELYKERRTLAEKIEQ